MEQAQTIQLERQGFWVLSLTLFIVAYNVSVLPAIMPAIVRDFNSSIGSIQSILVLFSLIMASFAPTTENLCRFYGRTRVFFTGLTLYGIGITGSVLDMGLRIRVNRITKSVRVVQNDYDGTRTCTLSHLQQH